MPVPFSPPKTFPGSGYRLQWSFEDPAKFKGTDEEKLNKFRDVRDQVKQKVQEWVASQN